MYINLRIGNRAFSYTAVAVENLFAYPRFRYEAASLNEEATFLELQQT